MFQSLSYKSTALGLACLTAIVTASPVYAQATSPSQDEFRITQNVNSKAIAVVDFSNDTGDKKYDNLKRGISESLSTRLAKRPELTLIERGQIDKAIKELGFAQTGMVDSNTASKLGKMAGANAIVTGSLVRAGSLMQINVRMVNVETGQIMVSENYTFGSENEVFAVVDYLALLIPRKLNLYVSDRELDLAKQAIRGGAGAIKGDNDMGWIIWAVVGGVVVAGGIAAAVVLLRPSNNINIVNRTGDSSKLPDRTTRSAAHEGLNLPLLRF